MVLTAMVAIAAMQLKSVVSIQFWVKIREAGGLHKQESQAKLNQRSKAQRSIILCSLNACLVMETT